jgi:hypothetical protein
LVEVVAHGDHVLLARQSSEVAVQHEHERPAAVVAEPPGTAFVIDEGDVGEHITLADHATVVHAFTMSPMRATRRQPRSGQ